MIRIVVTILMFSFTLPTQTASAQCPDRQLVEKMIVELRTSTVPEKEQLDLLLPRADSMQKCAVANDTVLAHLMQRVGALYFHTQDISKATFWTERSADIMKKCLVTPATREFRMKLYNYLARFYDSLSMPSAKMEAIDSLVTLSIHADKIDPRFLNNVLDNVLHRTQYCFDRGDYQRSLEFSKMGRDLIHSFTADAKDSADYGRNFFTSQVNSLIYLREYPEAEKLIWQNIDEYKKQKNEKDCGVFYRQLSSLSSRKQDYRSALSFLKKSLKCDRETHYQVGCKQTLNSIGFLYETRFQNFDSALIYFKMAANCKNDRPENSADDVLETLNVYDNIGSLYARKKQFDSASVNFNRAFAQLSPGLDENSVVHYTADQLPANKDMTYVTTLVKDKADSYVMQYQSTGNKAILEKAIYIYRIADQLLNRVRFEQAEINSGLAWRSNSRGIYEKAIDAAFFLHDADAAFYFFEKSRAALLNDQLSWQKLSTKEDVRRQVVLKRKLADLNRRLNESPAPSPAYSAIQKDIYSVKLETNRISLDIRRRDPSYYRNFLDTSWSGIGGLQKNILGTTHALMEIFYGDSAVYALFISSDQTRLTRIDKQRYDILTHKYIGLITHPSLLNRNYGQFLETAGRLYQLLLAGCKTAASSWIISPDGEYFPFESLVTDNRSGKPVFLIADKAISYSYSANFLHSEAASDKQDETNFLLGMAPVSFGADHGLASLPGSDKSLEDISARFAESRTFTNASASRANFLNNFFNYRVIQLYTHGSGGSLTEEPQIYFADSSLKLSDIDPVMRPQTRLVVLSGCETGNGTFYQGEGVFSFNRTFASIGIPSAMVNLWSVDNEAVYALTNLFYKYLAQGLPLDKSLQKAKLEFMESASKDRSMPYFWAPAVIVGKTDAVVTRRSLVGWYWGIFLIVLMAGGIVANRMRK